MESTTTLSPIPPTQSPHAQLWRTLRRTYLFILAAHVAAGAIAGFFTPHLWIALSVLFIVCTCIACAGLGIHLGYGLRAPISKVAVSIEAVLAGAANLVVGGIAAAVACTGVYGVQVERTKAAGDAVIAEVRAYKDAHRRWPASLEEAGIDPRRLTDAPLELDWVDPPRGIGVPPAEDRVPSIRFVRHPGLLGATFRDADKDEWTVQND